MGLVLSAATGRGWTTGSGMEGPSVPAGAGTESGTERISTFPWSLFTKSPRRRMRVAFTCNVCGQRTTRAINPHAYTDGTVFVQVKWLMKNPLYRFVFLSLYLFISPFIFSSYFQLILFVFRVSNPSLSHLLLFSLVLWVQRIS